MTDAPSSSPRRALRVAALYAALVGGPALGVAATLYVGQGLTAPPAAGGVWRVEPEVGGCARAGGTLRVVQSGARIDAVYAPAGASPVGFRGRVAGGRAVLGEAGSCERVEARVPAGPGQAPRLEATIQTGVCGCRTTIATLVRVADAPPGGGL